jgi:AraC-like DNA-binding protein
MSLHEYKIYQNTFKLPIAILKTEQCDFVSHWHYDVELAFILSGGITVGFNGYTKRLHCGDIFLCADGDIHSYFEPSKDSLVLILMLNPIIMRKAGTLVFDLDSGSGVFNPRSDQRGICESILNKLFDEYTNLTDTSIYFIYAAIMEIQGMINRYYKKETIAPPSTQKQHLHLQNIRESISFIEDNYQNEINIEEMAKRALMSVSNYSRQFKNITGTGFKEYVTLVRLRAVSGMIKKKDMSISQIAFDSGFNSIRTFNRVFQNYYHMSPSKYMESMIP